MLKRSIKIVLYTLLVLIIVGGVLSYRKKPTTITYGVSFSKFHADELKLPWAIVFEALVSEMQVKHWRLSAHWPMVESTKGVFSFNELDYQLRRVKEEHGDVVLAVGRRLPGWPECHVPEWAKGLSWEDQKKEILTYLTKVVERYKDHSEVLYWQVENEPYLTVFAHDYCGDLDKDFLKEEVALVKRLDPSRKVLVTDSGNLGLWSGAWSTGDIFGTSMYLYLWNPNFGQVKTIYQPFVYRIKNNMMSLLFGKRESLLIELSLEPWLVHPIIETPLSVQKERMTTTMFDEAIVFAKNTRFEKQYLWGAEWWFYMKQQGDGTYWEKAKAIFAPK